MSRSKNKEKAPVVLVPRVHASRLDAHLAATEAVATGDLIVAFEVLSPFKFLGVVLKPPLWVEMDEVDAAPYQDEGVLGTEAILVDESSDDDDDDTPPVPPVNNDDTPPAAPAANEGGDTNSAATSTTPPAPAGARDGEQGQGGAAS